MTQIVERLIKKEMHIFKAFIKTYRTLLQRSHKGTAFFFMTCIKRDAQEGKTHKTEVYIFEDPAVFS